MWGESAFPLGCVKQTQPLPSLKLAGIGMHHKSPGCSCDWIIYSSNLTSLTRNCQTKGKVMKSHLSCLSLTPHRRAFQSLWLKEGGKAFPSAASLPSLLPLSLPLSSHTHFAALRSLSDTASHVSLSRIHFLTDADISVQPLPPTQLALPGPLLSLQAHSHMPALFLPSHRCLPAWLTPFHCVCLFALSMKTRAR